MEATHLRSSPEHRRPQAEEGTEHLHRRLRRALRVRQRAADTRRCSRPRRGGRRPGRGRCDAGGIVGHTDATGTDSYNQDLSERRARSVSGYLEKQVSVSPRYSSTGKGETDPVADNETADGRRKNRRVTITYDK
ncbi:MAG: OmpA family protein [Streptosporangiales bacterium]|nr:OmpA family protein [Streptosporangiales bacterium]